jgi:transketolase
MNSKEIKSYCIEMRKIILKTSNNCNQPTHIGGALSIVEILAVLYLKIMKINLKKPKDRFILSKGHGFLGLLSILKIKKFINQRILDDFQRDGTDIIAHPIMRPELGIETSNGSLGQGLSFGVGLAKAYKLKGIKNSIYVLVGDGECYEGSIWEAAITATEMKLDNLNVFIDVNGFQNDGKVNDKMNHLNLYSKWKGFGWNVKLCDGHNIDAIIKATNKKINNKPNVMICKTIKGKGVKFMENNNDWHHGRLTNNLYKNSIKNINES